jgi:hypothetical protein
MVRLNFASIATGAANFGLTLNALADAQGDPLNDVSTSLESVTITKAPTGEVPEPGTASLLALALLVARSVARRRAERADGG